MVCVQCNISSLTHINLEGRGGAEFTNSSRVGVKDGFKDFASIQTISVLHDSGLITKQVKLTCAISFFTFTFQ